MTILIAPPRRSSRPARRERRAERRRLKRLDALSAQLADLHAIRELIDVAAEVVTGGWVQGAWFTVETADGERAVPGYDVTLAEDLPVVRACLVGAVVHAAGGPSTVRTQTVQRSLEVIGHTLREDQDRPVRWCPGPNLRAMTVLELTHWNDSPTRAQDEVVDLLRAARRTADTQRARCLSEQSELDAVHDEDHGRTAGARVS